MKRKLLSIMLSIAVVFSFMPLFTLQANAASDGSKTLRKTKTVTIQPGKTYKSPKFKLPKKMSVQVPITITLPGKIKESDYGFKLKYTMSLKTAKGKTQFTYKCPAQGIVDNYTFELKYDRWIYTYGKSIKKPGYKKGKYYITIKNTTKRPIKVKYSVRGYTKIASTANLKSSVETSYEDIGTPIGTVGPGLPITQSITSSNKDLPFERWTMSKDGKLKVYFAPKDNKDHETTVTVTLNNGKKYNVKVKWIGDYIVD